MLCLLFLFWATLAIYVEVKKDSLLEKARSEINSRIGGTLQIGHADSDSVTAGKCRKSEMSA